MEVDPVALNNEFIAEFECPVCARYIMPPINQCYNGHCFCSTCFDRISRCAVCRSPKSNYRCVTLEKLHACLIFPCEYADQGCDFQAPGEQTFDHQKQCKFSLVPCPLRFNGCEWRGKKSEQVFHCQSEHVYNIFFSSRQKLMSSGFAEREDRVYYIVFYVFNCLFRCTWDVDKATGMVRFGVYCLGKQDKFGFEVSFSDGETVSMRAPCYPMRDDTKRFLEKKYFILHHDHIKDLCDDDGDLNYIVNIFKIE